MPVQEGRGCSKAAPLHLEGLLHAGGESRDPRPQSPVPGGCPAGLWGRAWRRVGAQASSGTQLSRSGAGWDRPGAYQTAQPRAGGAGYRQQHDSSLGLLLISV